MEETAREREERLKGWSTFLDTDSKKEKQDPDSSGPESGAIHDASGPAPDTVDPAPHTPGATPDTPDPTADLTSATSEPSPETKARPQEQREEEVGSTDSSLAGSDDEA